MSLKNVPTTKCHKECLTQSAHVFVLGRPKSHKKSPTILLLDMWHLKSAQEKQNVNRARELVITHYKSGIINNFELPNEEILWVLSNEDVTFGV